MRSTAKSKRRRDGEWCERRAVKLGVADFLSLLEHEHDAEG